MKKQTPHKQILTIMKATTLKNRLEKRYNGSKKFDEIGRASCRERV